MPQKSKKPTKKAVLRAPSANAASPRSAPKAPRAGAKRSAVGSKKPKAPKPKAPKPKAKGKAQKRFPKTKPLQAKSPLRNAVPKARALSAKPPPRKTLSKILKPGPLKVPARPARTLILPPKPTQRAARLNVAPAPRTPSVAGIAPHTPSIVSIAARAPSVASVAPRAIRTRTPRARLTPETWQKLDVAALRLGRAALNDEQRFALRAALEGHDSLVVLADDERAVSCYQLAAQLLDQPTLLISPVQAELRTQAEALSQRKIPVVCLVPELAGPDRSTALARIARGGSLLVLSSPEALRAADVRQALAKSGIALFVVEEAHCASEASHELRPSYTELAATRRAFDSPPVMAVTRVATRTVRRDISERLGLNAPVTVLSAPVRENLQLITKLARGEGRQASLVRLIERLTLPGLVFCATPHDVDGVYAALRGAGMAAHRHHGGMTPSDRAAELLNFTLPGQRSVMVAVSAFAPGSGLPGIGEQTEAGAGFGRGPGKRDLRFVVHYQSPASLEQYLREIQRAGGDGLPAQCVLLHESSHRSLHEVMLAQQRFRATHLAELGRALETPALEGRTVTVEALALATGQSRRTTDRLTALLADAGVVSRTGGWVRVLCSASELDEMCRRLGAQLYALREQDARRLASVSAFAESSECKLSCLSQYLGEGSTEPCGRCNACVSELLAPSQDSLVPLASQRRAVVQEFSVQSHDLPQPADRRLPGVSGVVPNGAPLTAKLADFGGNGGAPRN